MKKIEALLIILIIALVTSAAKASYEASEKPVKNNYITATDRREPLKMVKSISVDKPVEVVKYTSLGVPNINSSFKTWMSYRAVTNKKSPQYKFINTYGWADKDGFMRCSSEKELGINQDYYMIALGSYYGTTIGTKYRITLSTGKVFYGILADCKANRHTNRTNQYARNNDVVEFIVDTKKLNSKVKLHGNANVYAPLRGSVVKIEKIDFVNE